MTREQKLALIVGFALVLVVGVLVSDHFSLAQSRIDPGDAGLADALEPDAPGFGRDVGSLAIADAGRRPQPVVLDETYASGPDLRGDEERNSLEERTMSALGKIAQGIDQAGDLLRESQNGNLPAAQVDTLEMPSIRDAERRAPERAAPPPITNERPARDQPHAAPPPKAKNYPVHVVKEGESLWTIAERYYADGTLYTKLAAFNTDRTGPDNAIYAGASLLVPPLDVLDPGAKRAQVKATPRRGSDDGAARSAPTREYVVESGDTLSEISQKLLGTSKRWQEIMKLNGMTDPGALRVGMKIKIPTE